MYDIFNVFFTLKFSGDQLMNTWGVDSGFIS